jgi:arylsulfatase A-like enzyme
VKRILWTVVAIAIAAGGTYAAIGGREGALLAYVKWVQRKEPLPNQPVVWQPGPANAPAAGAKRPPNVIVILADDLGYNDITLHGGGVAGGAVPTPSIDSIARQGVNFTSGYAGNATCSPSRASLLTGRYATRFGFEFTAVPVQFSKVVGGHDAPGSPFRSIYHAEREADLPDVAAMGMPTSELTMATLLKKAGYRTLHLGKWHLGEEPRFQPNAHGFDESLSIMSGAGMFLHEKDPNVVNAKVDFDPIDKFLWAAHPWGVQFNGGPKFAPSGYVTDYLTDEAIKAIDANRNRPFMMYLAYNAPHTPLQATKADYDALPQIKDHTLRVYAAMIRSLDRNIGRVLDALESRGLDQDTIVVFTSDNGGAHYIGLPDLNKPFRGWKASLFEGGVRVPYFMRWPAAVAPGTAFKAPVSHFDIFATALAAAGVAPPADRRIDGVDLMPFVSGKSAGRPHDTLFWRSGPYLAVQSGDWKLQVTETPRKDWLYNVALDPTEKNNLALAQPAKVQELKALLAAFQKEQVKALWPSMIEIPVGIDRPLNRPPLAGDDVVYWSN